MYQDYETNMQIKVMQDSKAIISVYIIILTDKLFQNTAYNIRPSSLVDSQTSFELLFFYWIGLSNLILLLLLFCVFPFYCCIGYIVMLICIYFQLLSVVISCYICQLLTYVVYNESILMLCLNFCCLYNIIYISYKFYNTQKWSAI